MPRIAELLSFQRVTTEFGAKVSEAKCDLGGEQIVTARYYGQPGFDPHPLAGDFALLVEAEGKGNWVAVGFLDPSLVPEAAPGEVLVYSRSAPGVIAAKVHLKADGSVVINDAVTISPSGAITADGDVVAGSISLQGHTHGYIDNIGDPPSPTPSDTDPPS